MTPECWEPGCQGQPIAWELWHGDEDWGYCEAHLVDRNALSGVEPLEARER